MFQLGVEFHTFSIVARCQRTGMLGVGITTRPPAVGSRCPYVEPDVGAISTQANADPRLGIVGIRLLQMGFSPSKVLQDMESSDTYIEYRQLGIVDREGNTAVRTGSQNRDWAGHIAKKNYVAMGNNLLGEHVVQAMARAFEESPDEDLEERLMRAIEAGRDAGGQHGGQRSASLLVYQRDEFPRVSLRVDDHDEPLVELRRLLELYKPLIPYYQLRPSDPTVPHFLEWLQQQRGGTPAKPQ